MTVDNNDGRSSAARRSPAVVTAAAVIAVSVVGVLVWVLGPGAGWVLRHLDGVTGLHGKDKADALDAIRGRVITIATGILAIVAVYYTARNAQTARRTLEHSQESARRTAELTEQGQVTERYTKAIEQLGAGQLDIRIGGIYALERIARDSARDHPTIIEVLAAFVREHSHDEDGHARHPDGGVGRLRPDLQAALTVIGRRTAGHDTAHARIDLNDADLRQTNLFGADLTRAVLTDANLNDANLTGAILTGAILANADLAAAMLNGADLTRAYLNDTDLPDAFLIGANLTGADLTAAVLTGANLMEANLTGANLTAATLAPADLTGAILTGATLFGADLTDADLTGANLTGAILMHANLSGANVTGATLTGATLTGALGLSGPAPEGSPGTASV